MIDTPNHHAPIAVTTEVVESAATVPIEELRHSPQRLEDPGRCQYRYPNGRRCTLPGLPSRSGFCLRHHHRQVAAGLPLTLSPSDTEDLSADLLPDLTEFSSGQDVRKFLTRLVVQVTRGRVSPRRAAVLGYLTNQILHSHRAIDKESENEPQQFIFDLPRPKRD